MNKIVVYQGHEYYVPHGTDPHDFLTDIMMPCLSNLVGTTLVETKRSNGNIYYNPRHIEADVPQDPQSRKDMVYVNSSLKPRPSPRPTRYLWYKDQDFAIPDSMAVGDFFREWFVTFFDEVSPRTHEVSESHRYGETAHYAVTPIKRQLSDAERRRLHRASKAANKRAPALPPFENLPEPDELVEELATIWTEAELSRLHEDTLSKIERTEKLVALRKKKAMLLERIDTKNDLFSINDLVKVMREIEKLKT